MGGATGVGKHFFIFFEESYSRTGMSTAGTPRYDPVGGPMNQWSRGICGFVETCAGAKACVMAVYWPCFGPCLYSKISARTRWPSTQFEAFGDTPFKQWFRISLLLVLLYWFFAWGEGITSPKPKFNVITASQADLQAFEKMDKLTTASAANLTGDNSLGTEGAQLDKTLDDNMGQIDAVGEVPALEDAAYGAEFSPFHHLLATLKWIVGVVWLVLVIMLRAHTREQVVALEFGFMRGVCV